MRFILAFSLVFTSLILSAQLNPKTLHVNAKESVMNTIELNSFGFAPHVTIHPDSGHELLDVDHVSGTTYHLNFQPTTAYTGDTKLTIQYYEQGAIPGIPYPNYTTVHYRVKSSKIDLGTDYELVSSDTFSFNPLSNDNSTDGALSLSHLGEVSGGTAVINGSDQIEFSFEASEDEAYVRYFASDSTGNVEGAVVHLNAQDEDFVGSRSVFVDQKSSINLALPGSSFTLDEPPSNGSVSLVGGHLWSYTPTSAGLDSLSFVSATGGSIDYFIDVLGNVQLSTFVLDDEIFCVTNGACVFNVFDNDLKNDQDIIEYSPELTYNGDGEFSYIPPADFKGDRTFYYKVFSGWQFHIGHITVHIDDFAPSNDYKYTYNILQNHDLVLSYGNHTSEYYFESIVDPSNGSLTILDANGSEVLECATIIGENKIVYHPNEGFDGVDEFDIEYCTNTGDCKIIKVDVNILDSNYDPCLCLNSCVYPGDNNDDGVVNMKDILDLGLNIGEGGPQRTNDFPLIWTGQESSDWGHQQMGAGIDLKCGDSDGDGYIDETDIDAISDYYGNIHGFVADPVGALSSVPITFHTNQTEVDSGEWLFLEVHIGNASQPAIDFYGTAFTFFMNPALIDSSTVTFELEDDNWLEYESPLKQITRVPLDGQVDIGISRVSNVSADGIGLVGTLSFIVEDVIEGFKGPGQLVDQLNIRMSQILSTNELGQYQRHPDFEMGIPFSKDDSFDDDQLKPLVNVYPNPTQDVINIKSDKYSIDKVELYNALGQLIQSHQKYNSHTYTFDISGLNDGVLFAKIYNNGAVTTKTIQKFK